MRGGDLEEGSPLVGFRGKAPVKGPGRSLYLILLLPNSVFTEWV